MENLAMKKFLEMILERASEFINYKKDTQEVEEDNANILQTIETALQKKSGVHVIFSDKSFTGDIGKYDKERQQLIVKNFQKSMSTIIRISDIKRIRLVPNTIREAQKRNSNLN